MFTKERLDALLAEIKAEYRSAPDYGELLRDANIGIALSDAGRPYDDQIDPRIAELIRKHTPAA